MVKTSNKEKSFKIILVFSLLIIVISNINTFDNKIGSVHELNLLEGDNLEDLKIHSSIFNGNLDSLNITDYGNLYIHVLLDMNLKSISINFKLLILCLLMVNRIICSL